MSKKSFYYFAVLSLAFCFSLSIQAQQVFIANLSGLQEVPANNSSGRGICRLSLNRRETVAEIFCRYENFPFPPTAAGFFAGASVGGNGVTLVGIAISAGGGANGDFSRIINLTPSIVAELRANRTYLKISSQSSPSATIRGQFHLANGTYNDFDGDGRTDLTVYRTSNRSFYSQSSLSGNLSERQIGSAGDSVSLTVDFDGDGKSDYSTAAYNGNFIWRVFHSTTNTLKETAFGGSAFNDFFAAGDYDGDGAFDIAVYRGGVWYIIESSTGNYRYEYFGANGDIPAPNDFDKDGKADLAVARSENGVRVWYVRRSSDNQNYRVEWGLSSDAFFTGRSDFDGDGAADISVIRNESGQRVFYIRRSSDNQLQTIRWGASNDVVKLGDYDGDGKTDAAVTRAFGGSRVFFILQSSDGQPRYEYFGLPGDF